MWYGECSIRLRILKAGQADQEYREKQEMRLILNIELLVLEALMKTLVLIELLVFHLFARWHALPRALCARERLWIRAHELI